MNFPTYVMTESDRISVEYRTTTEEDILVLTLDVIGRVRNFNVFWENNIGLGDEAYTGPI